MAVPKKLTLHLADNKIKFDVVEHKKVYTAYDLAQTLGEEMGKIAKSLLVEVDLPALKKKSKNYYVVVVPASYRVDLEKVKKVLKAARVELAPEKVMKKLGVEPGALSPFGTLRGLGVIVDKTLLKAEKALVGAESFTESLRLKVADLVKLEKPLLAAIAGKGAKKVKAGKKSARRKMKK